MLSRIYPAIHERISYMLLQNSKGDYNIFYVDYLTQQLVYLSSKLQSLYNEELGQYRTEKQTQYCSI